MSDYENDGIGFDVWTYVARLGCRVRPSSDPFFADGDAVCQVYNIIGSDPKYDLKIYLYIFANVNRYINCRCEPANT